MLRILNFVMRLFFVFIIPLLFLHCTAKRVMSDTGYRYLALGDSYTIGESVSREAGFPYQTVRLLKEKNILFSEPQIIAKTGWTTAELISAINSASLNPPYDIVSLLIGVNNQYRGYSRQEYTSEFKLLLEKAIQLAGNRTNRVFVLSIPDWGSTPFAEGRNRELIAKEIDEFNALNESISKEQGVVYINITPGSRDAVTDRSLVASDGLHPSGKEYAKWASALAQAIESVIK